MRGRIGKKIHKIYIFLMLVILAGVSLGLWTTTELKAADSRMELEHPFIFQISTGSSAGEEVNILRINYMSGGREYRQYVFPHEGDLGKSFKEAQKYQKASDTYTVANRIEIAKNVTGYKMDAWDTMEVDGLRSNSTDYYLINFKREVDCISSVEALSFRREGESKGTIDWMVLGMRFYEISKESNDWALYGIGMKGYLSDDYYIRFKGKLRAKLDLEGYEDGYFARDFVNTFTDNKESIDPHIENYDNASAEEVTTEKDSVYHLKVDMADRLAAGIDAYCNPEGKNSRTLTQMKLPESMVCKISYSDADGAANVITIPLVTSCVTAIAEQGVFEENKLVENLSTFGADGKPASGMAAKKIIELAEQGGSLVVPLYLPLCESIQYVNISYATGKVDEKTGLKEIGTSNVRNAVKKKMVDESDNCSLVAVSVMKQKASAKGTYNTIAAYYDGIKRKVIGEKTDSEILQDTLTEDGESAETSTSEKFEERYSLSAPEAPRYPVLGYFVHEYPEGQKLTLNGSQIHTFELTAPKDGKTPNLRPNDFLYVEEEESATSTAGVTVTEENTTTVTGDTVTEEGETAVAGNTIPKEEAEAESDKKEEEEKKKISNRLLVVIKTGELDLSATESQIQMRIKYVSKDGKELETDDISLADMATEFYGYIPDQNGQNVAGQIGTQVGNTFFGFVNFDVAVKSVKGATFKLAGGEISDDDWNITSFQLYNVETVSVRTGYWIDETAIAKHKIDRIYTRKVNGLYVIDQNLGVSLPAGEMLDEISGEKWLVMNIKPNLLITSGKEAVLNFDGTVQQEDAFEWRTDYREKMEYAVARRNLGFSNSKISYDVSVTVGKDKDDGSGNGDCGSKNLFFFQLIFEKGSSAIVQANQQLSSDGFRAGVKEQFTISVNQDFGAVKAIRVIPDVTQENSDIYDKLKIDNIDVFCARNNGISYDYEFKVDDWVGIDIEDDENTDQGKDISEVARVYAPTSVEDSVVLEFVLTMDSKSEKNDYSQFQGTVEADIDYVDTEGKRQNESIDVVMAMYKYRNKTENTESLRNEMFKPNRSERFHVQLKNVQQIMSIDFLVKSKDEKHEFNVASVGINRVSEIGTLGINYLGEYEQYSPSRVKACSTTAGKSIEVHSDVTSHLKLQFGKQDGKIYSIGDIREWPFSIENAQEDGAESVRIYSVWNYDKSKDPNFSQWEKLFDSEYMQALLTYKNSNGDSFTVRKGLEKEYLSQDQVAVMVSGIGVRDLATISQIDLGHTSVKLAATSKMEAVSEDTSAWSVGDLFFVQHIRGGRVIKTMRCTPEQLYKDPMGSHGVRVTQTAEYALSASDMITAGTQKLYLQLGDIDNSTAFIPRKRDFAFRIHYSSAFKDMDSTTYRSDFVYLSDILNGVDTTAGETEKEKEKEGEAATTGSENVTAKVFTVKDRQYVEITFHELFVKDITEIGVAATGSSTLVINNAAVATFSSENCTKDNCTGWYNVVLKEKPGVQAATQNIETAEGAMTLVTDTPSNLDDRCTNSVRSFSVEKASPVITVKEAETYVTSEEVAQENQQAAEMVAQGNTTSTWTFTETPEVQLENLNAIERQTLFVNEWKQACTAGYEDKETLDKLYQKYFLTVNYMNVLKGYWLFDPVVDLTGLTEAQKEEMENEELNQYGRYAGNYYHTNKDRKLYWYIIRSKYSPYEFQKIDFDPADEAARKNAYEQAYAAVKAAGAEDDLELLGRMYLYYYPPTGDYTFSEDSDFTSYGEELAKAEAAGYKDKWTKQRIYKKYHPTYVMQCSSSSQPSRGVEFYNEEMINAWLKGYRDAETRKKIFEYHFPALVAKWLYIEKIDLTGLSDHAIDLLYNKEVELQNGNGAYMQQIYDKYYKNNVWYEFDPKIDLSSMTVVDIAEEYERERERAILAGASEDTLNQIYKKYYPATVGQQNPIGYVLPTALSFNQERTVTWENKSRVFPIDISFTTAKDTNSPGNYPIEMMIRYLKVDADKESLKYYADIRPYLVDGSFEAGATAQIRLLERDMSNIQSIWIRPHDVDEKTKLASWSIEKYSVAYGFANSALDIKNSSELMDDRILVADIAGAVCEEENGFELPVYPMSIKLGNDVTYVELNAGENGSATYTLDYTAEYSEFFRTTDKKKLIFTASALDSTGTQALDRSITGEVSIYDNKEGIAVLTFTWPTSQVSDSLYYNIEVQGEAPYKNVKKNFKVKLNKYVAPEPEPQVQESETSGGESETEGTGDTTTGSQSETEGTRDAPTDSQSETE